MNILLDTNVCIAALNGRPRIVRERLDRSAARGDVLTISTIVIFELHFGIAKSERSDQNRQRLELFLTAARILPFDAEDARLAGEVRHELERIGKPIGAYDYLIAAQALRHDLLLITANEREFSRVKGLRWDNWAK